MRVSPRAYLRNCAYNDLHIFAHVTCGCGYVALSSSAAAAIRHVGLLPVYERRHICTQWAIWRRVDTVAVSDVIASSCATAACRWLRGVLGDGGRSDWSPSCESIGGGVCDTPFNCLVSVTHKCEATSCALQGT